MIFFVNTFFPANSFLLTFKIHFDNIVSLVLEVLNDPWPEISHCSIHTISPFNTTALTTKGSESHQLVGWTVNSCGDQRASRVSRTRVFTLFPTSTDLNKKNVRIYFIIQVSCPIDRSIDQSRHFEKRFRKLSWATHN